MKIIEIGTGYTSIPADKGAATEIVVDNLSRALIEQGHDVAVVDIEDSRRLPTDLPLVEVPMPRGFGATDEALGVRHKLKRVVYSARLASVLKRMLREGDERVVLHFHNQYNAYFFFKLTPKKLRKRALVCYTNHSGAWNDEWDAIAGTIRKRYFQEAYAQRHSNIVLTLNGQTALNLVEHIGVHADRVHLAANGVDVETYRPLSRDEQEVARARLLAPGAHYVFQCGSVYENKGQLVTARCLADRLKADPNCYFIFAGGVVDAAYLEEVLDFARSAGLERQIVYLGEKSPGSELAELYAAADLCVLPSIYEGFSMAALESLSCGTPVVQRATPRVISFANAEQGLLRFADEKEFAQLMNHFLDMPAVDYAAISASARRCVSENYSWGAVAQSLVFLLERTQGIHG